MKQRPEKSAFLLLALLLTACGTLDLGPRGDQPEQRRVYVNDAAANDSLRSTVINGGVYFVMQPGKKYSLRVEGAAAGEFLQVYAATGNVYTLWKNVQGQPEGTTQVYTVQDSTATGANYYLARLRSAMGGPGVRPAKVRLVPGDSVPPPSAVKVRLMMIRTLAGLPGIPQKEAFAHAFLKELATIYKGQDITLDTSYQIVEPTAPAMSVDFSAGTGFPGGAREANTIYLYLVNSITLDGVSNPNGIILGFAPREAFDFASSEVVLSVERSADPIALAVTAAHEMGHFIGLRHTTSTELDQRGDNDLSNNEDGFDSTAVCAGLTKQMLGKSLNLQQVRLPEGRPYCLRTAAASCPPCGDRSNLMFPYQCNVDQKTLVGEQSKFIRQNLRLFQR